MVRFSSCDFLFFIKDFERKKEPIKGGTTRKDGNSFEEEINVGKYVIWLWMQRTFQNWIHPLCL